MKTAWRAGLFREATRKVRKKYPNGKTWTLDGKIFLKTDLTAKVLKIDSYEDLKTLLIPDMRFQKQEQN